MRWTRAPHFARRSDWDGRRPPRRSSRIRGCIRRRRRPIWRRQSCRLARTIGRGGRATLPQRPLRLHIRMQPIPPGRPGAGHESPPAMAVPLMIPGVAWPPAAVAVSAAPGTLAGGAGGFGPAGGASIGTWPFSARWSPWQDRSGGRCIFAAGVGSRPRFGSDSLSLSIVAGQILYRRNYSLIVWPIGSSVTFATCCRSLSDRRLVNLIGWLPRWIRSLLRPLQTDWCNLRLGERC